MNPAHIISSLIFIITITILTGEKLNDCSNRYHKCFSYYMIPVHYRIKLTHLYEKLIYMENYSYWAKLLTLKNEYDSFYFHGESSTIINIFQFTQYIKLHNLNLNIIPSKITIIKNNGRTYKPKNYIEIFETNLLEFHFSDVLFPGLYTLKMEFLGGLTENSSKNFFKSFYTNKENSTA